MRIGVVSPTDAEFIQGSVIVGAEPFKESVDEGLAGIGTPGELMPVKMIEPGGDEDVLEDVERRGQALDEVVEQVIIGVRAIMKECAEGGLPLLRLQDTASIRLVPEKAFKVVFPDRAGLGSR